MPWWVPFVFLYCLWLGWHCSTTRSAPLVVFFIIPGVLMGLSVASLWQYPIDCAVSYIAGLIIGSFMGWKITKKVPISINKPANNITVPGSWQVMILMMVLFFTKFTFGSLRVRAPDIAAQIAIIEWIVQGGISGILLGKALNFRARFRAT